MPHIRATVRTQPADTVLSLEENSGKRGRILLVDDDIFGTPVLQNRLQSFGYEVVFAEGVTAAEQILACTEFDLILSDIHMPGNDHLEWTESLLMRSCPAPILLMTGNPAMETACRAANLPVAGYLIKPPDWATLDQRIQQAIAARCRRNDFVGLAREILDLVETSRSGPHDEILVQRLAALAASFLAESGRPTNSPHATAVDFHWRSALSETVAVIEKTRHSFRSKELGQLRRRLEKMLASHVVC